MSFPLNLICVLPLVAQPQSIPEGMIPKEVVARNRNRQAGIVNKSEKASAKANNAKSPGYKNDDGPDDG